MKKATLEAHILLSSLMQCIVNDRVNKCFLNVRYNVDDYQIVTLMVALFHNYRHKTHASLQLTIIYILIIKTHLMVWFWRKAKQVTNLAYLYNIIIIHNS